MSTGIPSASAQAQANADSGKPDFLSIGVRNTNIHCAPDVSLSPRQNLLVGSVLDLFEGHPTLKHLSLWNEHATFTDPLTIATTFPRFAAQWYGLPTLFHPIHIASHRVTSAGNPIELELRNRYTVKLVGTAHEIASTVRIFLDANVEPDKAKIDRVEDHWNGQLPGGAVGEACGAPAPEKNTVLLVRMATGGLRVAWWAFCWGAWLWPFAAFRKLNAVTVPNLVRVPKNDEEDRKMQEEREKD